MSELPDGPVDVTFWGTRGSISTPGRATERYGGNTPCVALQWGDTQLILDAGTGIRNLGIDLVEQYQEEGSLDLHLLLSHTHWDHIQGLPFFQPAYLKGVKFCIYGSTRKSGFLEGVLRGQMDSDYFPVAMSALNADLSIQEIGEDSLEIGPFKIDWEEQLFHPGGSVRYGFTCGDKRIVYATDVEMNKVVGKADPTEEDEAAIQRYLDFIRGADLLIGDGQYKPEEYDRYVDFGHTTIPVLIELAQQAEVKQLAIFHHDPQRSDDMLDEYLQELIAEYPPSDEGLSFFWAREGVTLPI